MQVNNDEKQESINQYMQDQDKLEEEVAKLSLDKESLEQ